MRSYGKLTAALVAGWFIFALAASALDLFRNNANRVGVAVAIAAVTPLLIFSAWLAASKEFRRFAFSLSPRVLTYVQTLRVVGVVFVISEAHRILPSIFALPAGYGDIAIGATASLVAATLATPSHRGSFIVWQILGITDLVAAVGLGTTARLLSPEGPGMTAVTVLPLSLIPTFLVPLFLMFHVICIAEARAWKRGDRQTTATAQDGVTGGFQAERTA
jgi:hypothetical protein